MPRDNPTSYVKTKSRKRPSTGATLGSQFRLLGVVKLARTAPPVQRGGRMPIRSYAPED